MARGEPFSMGMYGDGEWMAMFGARGQNAEATNYAPVAYPLKLTLQYPADNYFFLAPEIIKSKKDTGIGEEAVDAFLHLNRAENIEWHEKDIWDKTAREAGLRPFIEQIRKMPNVTIISNKALRGLTFLNYKHFIEIDYPNWYSIDEMRRLRKEIQSIPEPATFLVSAGLPAAIVTQEIHAFKKDSWGLDLGSIWDAFVGIGAQRGWRAELYNSSEQYELWKTKQLEGL